MLLVFEFLRDSSTDILCNIEMGPSCLDNDIPWEHLHHFLHPHISVWTTCQSGGFTTQSFSIANLCCFLTYEHRKHFCKKSSSGIGVENKWSICVYQYNHIKARNGQRIVPIVWKYFADIWYINHICIPSPPTCKVRVFNVHRWW